MNGSNSIRCHEHTPPPPPLPPPPIYPPKIALPCENPNISVLLRKFLLGGASNTSWKKLPSVLLAILPRHTVVGGVRRSPLGLSTKLKPPWTKPPILIIIIIMTMMVMVMKRLSCPCRLLDCRRPRRRHRIRPGRVLLPPLHRRATRGRCLPRRLVRRARGLVCRPEGDTWSRMVRWRECVLV